MASMICPRCGSHGPEKVVTPGSFLIELALWLFFLLPGLIYSIWRLTARKKVCSSCGADGLIPVDTPRGQQLLRELGGV